MLQTNNLSSKIRTNLLSLAYFWQGPHLRLDDTSTKTIKETYVTDNMKKIAICSFPCNFLISYKNYYETKTWPNIYWRRKC